MISKENKSEGNKGVEILGIGKSSSEKKDF